MKSGKSQAKTFKNCNILNETFVRNVFKRVKNVLSVKYLDLYADWGSLFISLCLDDVDLLLREPVLGAVLGEGVHLHTEPTTGYLVAKDRNQRYLS